jgi:hypothetical protein
MGIGSQRAGSTLLYKILCECTEIFMHPVKELHYFDTLFSVRNEGALRKYTSSQLASKSMRTKAFVDFFGKTRRERCELRALKMLNTRPVSSIKYMDLFSPCLRQSGQLGEVTPEYMILPEAGVRRMSEEIGMDARIILLCRHPVQRFISAVKLLKAHNSRIHSGESFSHDIAFVLQNMPKWIKVQEQLNDYQSALSKYQRYFPNVLCLSYDDFVTDVDKTHSQLEGFLDTQLVKMKYKQLLKRKINIVGKTDPVSQEVIEALEERFRSSISFLDERFGADACRL